MKNTRNTFNLVNKRNEISSPKTPHLNSTWVILSFSGICVLVAIGAFSDFIPSYEFYTFSKYLSLPISLSISVPFSLIIFRKEIKGFYGLPTLIHNTRNKVIFIILAFILLWFSSFIALARGAGYLLHEINHVRFNDIFTISDLRVGRRLCRYQVTFQLTPDRDALNSICLDDKIFFNTLEEHEKITVDGSISYFGFKVENLIKSNK